MTFLVGSTDYSAHVIAGTYEVNNEPVLYEWTDARKILHSRKIRDKVVGSFDMFFRTVTEYNAFKSVLDDAKSSTDEAYTLSVTVNDTAEQETITAKVSFKLVRNIDGAWNDYFERFTVNIEEC